ncbi:MAG: iron-containing alcohol dehydrogenase [Oscillospiraceae bacterium]|nr:iron-containing alcohol dehydrogenase [Oscillospiraceae bacterium]MDD3832625.1 iron-containing alcohol dehydrogenase [Oscillospiraceae bacterium]MDD4546202.1 iron-containing alcohol dehydrogenase [Oscillospiraceae bacterium]
MDFNLYMPVRVISGEDCILKNRKLFGQLGRRCLIMTGKQAAIKSGALNDIRASLDSQKIDFTIFSEISANPLLSQCQAAAAAADICNSDFIIGIGGGSVLDAAKAAAWLATNPGSSGERLMQGRLRHPPLPLVLVGTTAGTGSEVSAVAVLTMDQSGQKKSIVDPNCYAEIVFADPRYTHSVPRDTTVSTALDAFAHTVEGWFSPGRGDVITSFGEKALPLIMEGLTWLMENEGLPSPQLRERMYYGSLWAGMVLNATGTAFPHTLGYILTEDFNVPHGMACAVFMPEFLKRAEEFLPEQARGLYKLCGGRQRVDSILDSLVKHDVHMTTEQISGYMPRWEGVRNFTRSPGGFTPQEAARLLRKMFV